MRYPLDLVAHQGAAVTDGFLGRFPWVRDRSARALPFWSKDQPGYGTLLAFHGFGLEEAGDYARAEDESRAAAELEPLSFWPHHTVAHVMEMTGRPEDGLGLDGGARGAVVDPRPYEPGPYLVAQGALPSRTRAIRGGTRPL